MPGGRPLGSKNPLEHGAGGDRRSADFKQKKARKEAIARANFQRHLNGENKAVPISVKHPLEKENFEASQKLLAAVLDHPSMPKGKMVPTSGIVSDNGDIRYPSDASSTESKNQSFYRRKYIPDKGSPLRTFLDKAASEIKRNDVWKRRKFYYSTLESPFAKGLGSLPTPDKFYLPDLVRIWWPRHQFHRMNFEYKCPRCEGNAVKSNGIAWRPAFDHNIIRWVFCHDLMCTNTKCKGHTFNSTDPTFVSMLPTCIADSFEFVFPPQGPGVSRVMLRRLSLQIDNHVLFGPWVKEVNDMMWESYYQRTNQYSELLNEWLEEWPPVDGFDGRPPMHAKNYDGRPMVPYSAFGEPGHHNGIMMTEGLARTLFRLVEGGKRLQYAQSSFAAWHDMGIRADDTFKLPKKVFVTTTGRKRVRPFPGLLTMLSQEGKIVAAVWKMDMSHDTTRKILQEVKVARDHVGAPPLRLLQTDNPSGEQAPYYEIFPELQEGVVSPSSLPMIQIPADNIAFFDNGANLDTYILSFAHLFPESDQDIYYGLDTEFERDQTLTVLSLAFPQSMGRAEGMERDDRIPVAVVIHLEKIKRTRFSETLRRLLEQPNMIPVGRQIGGDCNKLEDQYGIRINRRVELQNLCKADRDLSRHGLKDLMKEYLQCTYPMNKSAAQSSSYAKAQLTDVDIQYCALDAAVSLWVCHRALMSLAKGGQVSDPHPTLQVGKRCTVTYKSREIASGRLQFVGAWGEQRQWGGHKLGRPHCLVTVENVIKSDHKPTKRHSSWPKEDETLGDLFCNDKVTTLELAVTVNQVQIVQEDGELSATPEWDRVVQSFKVDKSYVDALLSDAPANGGETPKSNAAANEEEAILEEKAAKSGSAKESAVVRGAAENDAEAESAKKMVIVDVITKSLRDLFHQIHCIPLPKGSEEIAEVLALILVATWINDEEDYENVVDVLQNKGVDNIFLHEFHNREYWRKRVKRNTPVPLVHASNVRMVKEEIWKTPGFENIRTEELEKWFETFAKNAEDGFYYVPPDMKMYKVDRVDSDGLNIYITDFGTNLNESLHQKYADLVGPFAVGVEMADLLLVLRSFRFNIARGITRCGEPDFHTDRHDIVDKTQHWMMQIFATFAWPTHKNLLDFSPPKTAALVGVRPLPLDPKHVTYAESPHASLSQDHKYLSAKLGVAVAPLPLSTREEFQLYNNNLRQIVAAGRKPSNDDWDLLAGKFLEKTDGKTIFPKTKEVLKKYYTHWKRNQSKRLFSKRVNIANSRTYKLLRQQKPAAAASVSKTELPSNVDAQFCSSKRPLEELQNVVPPASAYTQSHHVRLKTKRQRKAPAATEKERLTIQKIKGTPPDQLGRSSYRCVWYPVCRRQVWDCGGRKFTSCRFVNKDHSRDQTTDAEIARRKAFVSKEKKEQDSRRKQRRRAIERKLLTIKKNEKAAHLKTKQRTNQPDTVDLVDDIADEEFLSQKSVVVQSAHNSEEGSSGGQIIRAEILQVLITPTTMIDGDVVDAYLGLLADKCHFSRIRQGVGATNSSFWALLRNQYFGWDGAQKHLNRDHKINLIPAFFGPANAGHWAAVIVDSTISSGRRKILYFDSLHFMRQGGFNRVKELLRNWEGNDINFVMMDWPEQAGCSNDCAVFTLAACAYYVLREGNQFPSSFEFDGRITAAQFGRGWRRHVHKSIVNGRIDLNDDVLGWMLLNHQ